MKFAIIICLILIVCIIWRTEMQQQRLNKLNWFLYCQDQELERLNNEIEMLKGDKKNGNN
jgi:hypothetical protein